MVLAHAGPAQLGGGGTLQRYAAGGGGDAADGVAVQQTGLLCVLGDGLRAQFVGQLGEYAVAGAGKGVVDVHLSVGEGAGNGLPAHDGGAGTGEGALEQIRELLQGGREGDCLKDGAWGEGAGEKAVEVDALIPGVPVLDLGGGGGVEGGGGDHTEDLTGLVVIDAYRSLAAVEGLIGDVIQPGVQSEVEVVSLAKGVVRPGEEVIAGELVREGDQSAGADGAIWIAHGVEGGLSDCGVGVVAPLARLVHPGEHVPIPVQHPAHGQLPLAVVQVAVGGEGGPVPPVQQEPDQEQGQAQQQEQGEGQTDHRAFFNLFHRKPPFGLGRPWRGSGCPASWSCGGPGDGWRSWRCCGCPPP